MPGATRLPSEIVFNVSHYHSHSIHQNSNWSIYNDILQNLQTSRLHSFVFYLVTYIYLYMDTITKHVHFARKSSERALRLLQISLQFLFRLMANFSSVACSKAVSNSAHARARRSLREDALVFKKASKRFADKSRSACDLLYPSYSTWRVISPWTPYKTNLESAKWNFYSRRESRLTSESLCTQQRRTRVPSASATADWDVMARRIVRELTRSSLSVRASQFHR